MEQYFKTKVAILPTVDFKLVDGRATEVAHVYRWPLEMSDGTWELIEILDYERALPPTVGYYLHALVGLRR